MAERRRYTRRQRAAVVGLAEAKGVRAAARETGVPVANVSTWRNSPEFEQLRTRKKDEVAAEVWATFQQGVRRVGELIPETEDLQKVATATAIIYDKFALMSGHATERTESRDVTRDLDDHESEALRGAIERELSHADAG